MRIHKVYPLNLYDWSVSKNRIYFQKPYSFYSCVYMTSYFKIILDVQESCKNIIEMFDMHFTKDYLIEILYNHSIIIKTMKLTLKQYYFLSSRMYCELTSFLLMSYFCFKIHSQLSYCI